MSQQARQNPRTATSAQSIWKELPEDSFRSHLITLEERTNAIPVQPQVFPLAEHVLHKAAEAYTLPLQIEKILADDFAYIAAIGEGAQSVSAVCVEEIVDPPSLIIRFAAIDAVDQRLQNALEGVGQILSRAAAITNFEDDALALDTLNTLIIRQHYQKLLGRLRSSKWHKPKYLSRTHKKSLWQDFENLIHRIQFIYVKKNNSFRSVVEEQLKKLADTIKEFEDIQAGSGQEFLQLHHIVKACYATCQYLEIKDYAGKLELLTGATNQVAAAVKTFRQIEKIGAYYRIALDLTKIAKEYSELFKNIHFEYIHPYKALETNIGYESWAKTLHVHAEIQLAVHYDLILGPQEALPNPSTPRCRYPRVIGTSKYLCYLCYLFLKYHGLFIVRNTHGRLYDQWTVPDLADFDNQIVEKYRHVIKDIDAEVMALSDEVGSREGKRDAWRVEPMTSRQNLLSS